jgi:hypothetical protein
VEVSNCFIKQVSDELKCGSLKQFASLTGDGQMAYICLYKARVGREGPCYLNFRIWYLNLRIMSISWSCSILGASFISGNELENSI